MAKAQTTATRKYEQKVGIIAKSYKLRRELVDQFKEACDKAGVSQAGKLSEMMQNFIDECNEKTN